MYGALVSGKTQKGGEKKKGLVVGHAQKRMVPN